MSKQLSLPFPKSNNQNNANNPKRRGPRLPHGGGFNGLFLAIMDPGNKRNKRKAA